MMVMAVVVAVVAVVVVVVGQMGRKLLKKFSWKVAPASLGELAN
jgi:nitrate reductase gamma subunit